MAAAATNIFSYLIIGLSSSTLVPLVQTTNNIIKENWISDLSVGHRKRPAENHIIPTIPTWDKNQEMTIKYWRHNARLTLDKKLKQTPNMNLAKNVIFFLGDGMSIPTVTATRMYAGGEEMQLSFERFPYTGMSKTYCTDKQVADSACSATAYLGGVKANMGTLGVTANVTRKDCQAMNDERNHVHSLASAFNRAGRSSGFVTTAKVTDASPAGLYAHVAERKWEWDEGVRNDSQNASECKDIAWQLVHNDPGIRFRVMLGGGRKAFLPKAQTVRNEGRTDGENLIEAWLEAKTGGNHDDSEEAIYIETKQQLEQLLRNSSSDGKKLPRHIFGLFNEDHINYRLERTPTEPSLPQMTELAIKQLQQCSPQGYFLFVEGARIDMAHHSAQAKKALDETLEFSQAIDRALELVDLEHTLIVVTADHAHTLSFSGYPNRHNNIFGIAGMADDKLPYTTLSYANGPGYKKREGEQRYDVSRDLLNSANYEYPGIAPIEAETHGGDDVAIYAIGPWSHLFTGVIEQNVIPTLISYASCVPLPDEPNYSGAHYCHQKLFA